MRCLRVQRFARRQHSGFTLIELSAVVAVCSVLMGVAVSMILLLEKQEDRIGLKYQQTLDFSRLSDQLRKDVHQASSVRSGDVQEPNSAIVVCDSPTGKSVEYYLKDSHFIRQETDATGELQQERFLLPPRTNAGLTYFYLKNSADEATSAEFNVTMVQLFLSWPLAGGKTDKKRVLRIIAQPGKTLPVQLGAVGGNRDSSE